MNKKIYDDEPIWFGKAWLRTILSTHCEPKNAENDATPSIRPKNTGCMKKHTLGNEYDFVKHPKNIFFRKYYVSHQPPSDTTQRRTHVQTMLQLICYWKNTRWTTKNALGDRCDNFVKHQKKNSKKNTSHISSLDTLERYRDFAQMTSSRAKKFHTIVVCVRHFRTVWVYRPNSCKYFTQNL